VSLDPSSRHVTEARSGTGADAASAEMTSLEDGIGATIARPEPQPHSGSFADPRVLVPFVIITLIWGSTWIVIRDQLGPVPATWSVTYRYVIASVAMFAYAAYKSPTSGSGAKGICWRSASASRSSS
jgi:hypothetical protein